MIEGKIDWPDWFFVDEDSPLVCMMSSSIRWYSYIILPRPLGRFK